MCGRPDVNMIIMFIGDGQLVTGYLCGDGQILT